jgi:sugar phosphate permease
LPAGFAAGLAGLFSALRAEAGGAALARAGMDGFDFAATFLALEAALAMTDKQSARGEKGARLTPL